MERYEDLIIVSMTSWAKRIYNCKPVIESLIDQSIKPNYIELNLSLDEFPNKENDLPKELIDLINNNSIIEINWVEGNDGVFKKIIPTLKKFYGKTYYLLSVDDDWLYRSDYIEMMIRFIKQYNADTFCLANARVIGNRQIYKSDCFKSNFWEKLTQDVIDTRIDDMYIEHYLSWYNKIFSWFRPDDCPDITKRFNQVHPNSHNTSTGQYSLEDINKANNIIKSITFYE